MTSRSEIVVNTVLGAKALCYSNLSKQPSKLSNTLGVVRNCERLLALTIASEEEKDLLLMAAYLHGIGHNKEIATTKIPAYDTYKYLLHRGWNLELCDLVLHQAESRYLSTNGVTEIKSAYKRSLPRSLDEIYKILTVAIMTCGTEGNVLTLTEKYMDIKNEYGATSSEIEHVSGVITLCRAWELELSLKEEKEKRDQYMYPSQGFLSMRNVIR